MRQLYWELNQKMSPSNALIAFITITGTSGLGVTMYRQFMLLATTVGGNASTANTIFEMILASVK